jgi:hypothetical protein
MQFVRQPVDELWKGIEKINVRSKRREIPGFGRADSVRELLHPGRRLLSGEEMLI